MSGDFPCTEWTVVMGASRAPAEARTAALERLCRTYWPPIYAFLRRHGHDVHDAKDLTQGFILCLLERNSLAAVDPHKGRFRAYLLGALKHFLADQRKRERRQSRGGDREVLSLDTESAERRCSHLVSSDVPPDDAYDRQWAWTVLEQAVDELRAEFDRFGQQARFAVLRPYLTSDPGKGDYHECATRLGLKPGAVAVAIHRLRKRFQILVRRELARTVGNAVDLEAELRALLGAA